MDAVAAPADRARLEQAEALPTEPGVYLMKDRAGQVIYVGKATNVRRRVRSYFAAARDDRAFMPFLEREVASIEAIVVRNEKEALVLENELIKRHQPRFNVRLREGGQFVYLRLDMREPYPSLQVVRGVADDGARYFGPYPAARALRETLRVVNRHFGLRTCTDHDPRSHDRPCLLCQLSRFPEPSVSDVPPAVYQRRGVAKLLVSGVEAKMKAKGVLKVNAVTYSRDSKARRVFKGKGVSAGKGALP